MITKLLREMRRRKVIRAAITYLVSAWLIVEGADLVLDAFEAPAAVLQTLIAIAALGLPVALVFSWFFDISTDGIKRTEAEAVDDSPAQVFDRRSSVIIITLLSAGLLLSLYGNFRKPDAPIEVVSVLVADFDNQSGNALFTGVLEDFLLVGLEVAPFVSAYPRKEAITLAETLQESGSSSLDSKTASLVALREGIDVVIGGTVSRGSDGITVVVNSASSGGQQEVFSVSETVDTDADVLTAIVDISEGVRKKLGSNRNLGGAGAGA